MTMVSLSVNLAGGFKGLSLSSVASSAFLKGDFSVGPKSITVPVPQKTTFPLTIESAHRKGAGSTKNGRDSLGQSLGVKIFGDHVAKPGAIIVRQRGTKVHAGKTAGLGKDQTIFSLIDGLVKFEKFGPISVYPRDVQTENLNSYKARKREYFRLQREKKKARKEAYSAQPQLVLAAAVDGQASR